MTDPVTKRIRTYHNELFDDFDEFFRSITGATPEEFRGFAER